MISKKYLDKNKALNCFLINKYIYHFKKVIIIIITFFYFIGIKQDFETFFVL